MCVERSRIAQTAQRGQRMPWQSQFQVTFCFALDLSAAISIDYPHGYCLPVIRFCAAIAIDAALSPVVEKQVERISVAKQPTSDFHERYTTVL